MGWKLGWAGMAMTFSQPRTLLKLEGALNSPVIKSVNTTAPKPIIHLYLYYYTCTLLFNLPTYSSWLFFPSKEDTCIWTVSTLRFQRSCHDCSLLRAEFGKAGCGDIWNRWLGWCKCSQTLLVCIWSQNSSMNTGRNILGAGKDLWTSSSVPSLTSEPQWPRQGITNWIPWGVIFPRDHLHYLATCYFIIARCSCPTCLVA